MIPDNYTARSVAERFWLLEFKKLDSYIHNGYNYEEAKEKQSEENFLLAKSESYGIRTINTVTRRHEVLPKNISSEFRNFDLENQKYINLIGIMLTDKLFFEYIYEVYRPSIIEEIYEVTSQNDISFINDKSLANEKVASFTDQTKKRLISSYKNYLIEANFISKNESSYTSNKIYLDSKLIELLKDNNMYYILKAFVEENYVE